MAVAANLRKLKLKLLPQSCAARGAECRVVGLIKSTGVFVDKVRIVKM